MTYLEKIQQAVNQNSIQVSFTRNNTKLKFLTKFNPTPKKKLWKVMFGTSGEQKQIAYFQKLLDALIAKANKDGKVSYNNMDRAEYGYFESDGMTFVVDKKGSALLIYK